MRIMIFTNMISKYHALGDSDVERQIFSVIIIICLLLYISAGVFTGIENAHVISMAHQEF